MYVRNVFSIMIVAMVITGCSNDYLYLSDNIINDIQIEMFYAEEVLKNNIETDKFEYDGVFYKYIKEEPVITNRDYKSINVIKIKENNQLKFLLVFENDDKMSEVTGEQCTLIIKFNGSIELAPKIVMQMEIDKMMLSITEEHLSMIKDQSKLFLNKK